MCEKWHHWNDERFHNYTIEDEFIIESIERVVSIDHSDVRNTQLKVKWLGFGTFYTI